MDFAFNPQEEEADQEQCDLSSDEKDEGREFRGIADMSDCVPYLPPDWSVKDKRGRILKKSRHDIGGVLEEDEDLEKLYEAAQTLLMLSQSLREIDDQDCRSVTPKADSINLFASSSHAYSHGGFVHNQDVLSSNKIHGQDQVMSKNAVDCEFDLNQQVEDGGFVVNQDGLPSKNVSPHCRSVTPKADSINLIASSSHVYSHGGFVHNQDGLLSKKVYQCKICDKDFPSGQALGGHNKIHRQAQVMMSKNAVACEFDLNHQQAEDVGFAVNQDGLRNKKVSPHQCKICNQDFPSGQALDGHNKIHWQAAQVMSKNAVACEFDLNYQQAEKVSPHQCKICDQYFPNGQALDVHNKIHRQAAQVMSKKFDLNQQAQDGGFVVSQDGLQSKKVSAHHQDFPNEQALGGHNKIHMQAQVMSKNAVECELDLNQQAEYGGFVVSQDGHNKIHRQAQLTMSKNAVACDFNLNQQAEDGGFVVSQDGLQSKNVSLHECKICNHVFLSERALDGHNKIHRQAPSLSTFRAGKQVMSKVPLHKCKICNQVFPNGKALGGHTRKHRKPPSSSSKSRAVGCEFDLNQQAEGDSAV